MLILPHFAIAALYDRRLEFVHFETCQRQPPPSPLWGRGWIGAAFSSAAPRRGPHVLLVVGVRGSNARVLSLAPLLNSRVRDSMPFVASAPAARDFFAGITQEGVGVSIALLPWTRREEAGAGGGGAGVSG